MVIRSWYLSTILNSSFEASAIAWHFTLPWKKTPYKLHTLWIFQYNLMHFYILPYSVLLIVTYCFLNELCRILVKLEATPFVKSKQFFQSCIFAWDNKFIEAKPVEIKKNKAKNVQLQIKNVLNLLQMSWKKVIKICNWYENFPFRFHWPQ